MELAKVYRVESPQIIDYQTMVQEMSTKYLDLDMEPENSFLWKEGCLKADGTPYDCVRYRYSSIPDFDEHTGIYSSRIGEQHSFLYGIYLPCDVTFLRIYAYEAYPARKELIQDVPLGYQQPVTGTFRFHVPIPLRKLSHGLIFEYGFRNFDKNARPPQISDPAGFERFKDNLVPGAGPEIMDIVFFCGMGPGEFDIYSFNLEKPVTIWNGLEMVQTVRKSGNISKIVWELRSS